MTIHGSRAIEVDRFNRLISHRMKLNVNNETVIKQPLNVIHMSKHARLRLSNSTRRTIMSTHPNALRYHLVVRRTDLTDGLICALRDNRLIVRRTSLRNLVGYSCQWTISRAKHRNGMKFAKHQRRRGTKKGLRSKHVRRSSDKPMPRLDVVVKSAKNGLCLTVKRDGSVSLKSRHYHRHLKETLFSVILSDRS